MSTMLQEKYLTVREAAERLGVDPSRVHRFISSGRLSAIKVHPRLLLLREEEVERFAKIERKPGRPPKNGQSS